MVSRVKPTHIPSFTAVAAWLLLLLSPVSSFRSSIVRLAPKGQSTSFLARPAASPSLRRQEPRHSRTSSSTGLNMFMGSDGGILGVGTPEIATILLVGYFVLGPSDLYKLVKEIGKFIQNIRTLGNDLTTSLETNLESQLQLEEIRKAQQELNDAFSFRRTINTNAEEEAFATNVQSERPGEAPPEVTNVGVATAVGAPADEEGAGTTKKKIRRRVKKRAPAEIPPELEMPTEAAPIAPAPVAGSEPGTPTDSAAIESQNKKLAADPFVQDTEKVFTPEEEALINSEFDKYTSLDDGPSWLDDAATGPSADMAIQQPTATETSRFQQQLAGTWNDQILEKSEELAPLAKVMDLLALLEEEKIANQKRLEEEFRERARSEEVFYQRQRTLLEEAAAEVQSNAYTLNSKTSDVAISSSTQTDTADVTAAKPQQ